MTRNANTSVMAGQPNLEMIWSEYRTALIRFLRSKVSNQDDVEDLFQDILLKTYKNIGNLQESDKLKSWLFQIANNTIIDFYRRKGRSDKLHPDDLWYEKLDDEQHLLEPCVAPFIDALPSDLGKILQSIDIEGMSQKDYAAKHGIGYSTLKSRVQSGRIQLRKLFENCCDFTLDAQGNIVAYSRKAD